MNFEIGQKVRVTQLGKKPCWGLVSSIDQEKQVATVKTKCHGSVTANFSQIKPF